MPPTKFSQHSWGRRVGRTAGAAALAGVGLTAYAALEARAYTLRRVSVPLLPAGARPLTVLHLSDIHLTPGQTRKLEWVASLAELEPDLVVDTGDNLSHRDSVPALHDTLGRLLDVPGVFVLGSNDYFSPTPRNPLSYLLPDNGKRHTNVPQLPWLDLKRMLSDRGWLDLTNSRGTLKVGELVLGFVGVDDPHLRYDRLSQVLDPDLAPLGGDLLLGVAHAPYLRVLDAFAAAGCDAVLAGHTHGGQVCLPGWGALTTNCDIEPARAKGLHRHPADSQPGDPGSSVLHVSAGLGTNPYVRLRVACRPEATLLTLIPMG